MEVWRYGGMDGCMHARIKYREYISEGIQDTFIHCICLCLLYNQ